MSKFRIGAEAWNNRFSGDGWAYGKEPNEWLKIRIQPGNRKALVPADGEGRNAVYIASLGYETTVFDLSDVGKANAQYWQKRNLFKSTIKWMISQLEISKMSIMI